MMTLVAWALITTRAISGRLSADDMPDEYREYCLRIHRTSFMPYPSVAAHRHHYAIAAPAVLMLHASHVYQYDYFQCVNVRYRREANIAR